VAKILIIPVCILMAMRVFGYLSKEKATTFFHSLPFTRTKLFVVNALTGFLLIIIPLVFVGITTVIVAAVKGTDIIVFMIEWFLIICCECIYVYGFTILMAIIFGTKVSGYAMTGILFFYAEIIVNIYSSLYSNIHPSVIGNFIFPNGFFQFLSPISMAVNINVVNDYWTSTGYSYHFNNLGITIAEDLIVGGLMIAAAFLLYKHRKSEKSGEIIAFNSFRMVFKWGFALGFGAFLTLMLGETVTGNISDLSKMIIVQSCLFVFFVLLSYLIAEMIVQKKFNVFYKLRFEIFLPFAASIIVSLMMVFDVFGATRYVPDRDDIEYMNININIDKDESYYTFSSKQYSARHYISLHYGKPSEYELMEKFIDLHKYITAGDPDSYTYSNLVFDKDTMSYKSSGDNKTWVHIWYDMKDGTYITREYYVPFHYVISCIDYMQAY
jgi:ABC-2 type transport system permease protein